MEMKITEEMLQRIDAFKAEQERNKEIVALVSSVILNTKPDEKSWKFIEGAKVEFIHKTFRELLDISEEEWSEFTNNISI